MSDCMTPKFRQRFNHIEIYVIDKLCLIGEN